MTEPGADRWQHLVSGSFSLSGDGQQGTAAAAHYLESILEVFPPAIDPVEDFEGYAVRRMALSLLQALQKTHEEP